MESSLTGSPQTILDDSRTSPQAEFDPLLHQTLAHDAGLKTSTDNDRPLTKSSPKTHTEMIKKDPKEVVKDSNIIITFGLNQSRHQKEISSELIALLEHEKTFLQQLEKRTIKFSSMKEEHKQKLQEWESEHKSRISFYCEYFNQLSEIPETESISQEGVPGQVQQRILYKIVDDTSHVAKNAMVQMSMQNTVISEVELNLGKLTQFSTTMMKQIESWIKMLSTQAVHQNRVLKQWVTLTDTVKTLKEIKSQDTDGGGGRTSNDLQGIMNSVDARISKLENSVEDLKKKNVVAGSTDMTTGQPSHSQHPQRYDSVQQQQPMLQMFTRNTPQPAATQVPPASAPTTFPTGEVYFGIPMTSPPQTGDTYTKPIQPKEEPIYVEGRLQRTRAAPGQFSVDVLDIPGMGFPVPRSALEKENRQRGHPIPKTPPSPVPPNYGRFLPAAASSPVGSVREPQELFRSPPSQSEKPLDLAILPKVKEDLQRLSRRNKNLEGIITNFRKMRGLLSEEMDKAVRLNKKLQRDLYLIAQEAKRQPQVQ